MNYDLIKLLLESDFFVVCKKNSVISLKDPFLLVKDLKQFIRSLQSLDKRTLNLFYIWIENKYTLSILNTSLLQSNKPNLKILVGQIPMLVNNNPSEKIVLTSLDNSSSVTKTCSRVCLKNDIFLITQLTNSIEGKLFGSYKIQSDLNDTKRLCFLVSIIRHCFSSF